MEINKITSKFVTDYTFLNNNILFGFWAVERPKTRRWGCRPILNRTIKEIEKPDICFGKTDGIENIPTVDNDPYYSPTYLMNWQKMNFQDNQWNFGFWDPPYDKLYKKEAQEIWRVCQKLAILHTFMYPRAWFVNAKRIAIIAISLGPNKQIRCLQIFKKEITKKKKLQPF